MLISYLLTSLHWSLLTHDAPSKEVTDGAKPILGALKFIPEKLMLIRRLNLSPPDSLDGGILRRTDWAFGILTDIIQASLVERMLAEKVDGWKIQCAST